MEALDVVVPQGYAHNSIEIMTNTELIRLLMFRLSISGH